MDVPIEDDELLLRQMPHSSEGERAVLGSILRDFQCIPEVVEQLRPDDFYLPENREIYETVYSMFNLSQKVDVVTLLDKLKQNGIYKGDSTAEYLYDLLRTTPTAGNVQEYIAIVKDKALLRRIAETADSISALIQQGTEDGQHVLQRAEQYIYAIREGRSFRGLVPISDVLLEVYQQLDELSANEAPIPGISTGLTDLDRAISGLNKSDLILLAARPGMGKTSMALNILLDAGKKSGKSVAFFSLEMSREQLAKRLISSECFIDNKKLVTGKLTAEDWENILMATDSLRRSKILIDDDSTVTVADISAKCRRVKDLGLVIIDYLQLMQSAGGRQYSGENRQQVVSDISRSLKMMAKELNVPVLCLSQLSRANESRSDKRPMLSDLRESGAIEQDADIVMFLYREGYYDKDTPNPNLAECIIAKNRHGETRTVELQWLPEFTTFSNVEWQREEY